MRNPDAYHGENKGEGFFEGWYYKVTNNDNRTISIIIGAIKGDDEHSFVQFLDSKSGKCEYFEFKHTDFKANANEFEVNILDNLFLHGELILNLQNENKSVMGNLRFSNIRKWKNKNNNPSSMGPYIYLPLKCYSQVCFMKADVDGKINIDGEEIDFSFGSAYMEKNWGYAFPVKWVWAECENFDEEDVSLSCNIGVIDAFGIKKLGYTIGFMENNNFHIFRGVGKIFINNEVSTIDIKCRNKNESLTISIKKKDFILCFGPNRGNMNIKVYESLNSLVKVILESDNIKKTFFGKNVGLEINGF